MVTWTLLYQVWSILIVLHNVNSRISWYQYHSVNTVNMCKDMWINLLYCKVKGSTFEFTFSNALDCKLVIFILIFVKVGPSLLWWRSGRVFILIKRQVETWQESPTILQRLYQCALLSVHVHIRLYLENIIFLNFALVKFNGSNSQ